MRVKEENATCWVSCVPFTKHHLASQASPELGKRLDSPHFAQSHMANNFQVMIQTLVFPLHPTTFEKLTEGEDPSEETN